MSFIYISSKIVLYVFFKVFHRLHVIGSENVPKKGGVIVAANHVSYLDPPVIGAALKRRPTYIAMHKFFKIPLLGRYISSFSLPVNQSSPQPSLIKEAVKRLRNGELIVIFPEGGRSTHRKLLDAKRGIGMIAALSSAPVVPALIKGTEKALPVGAKFLRPSKIEVIFGNPIEIEHTETDKHFQERISRDIMETIKNLNSEELKVKSKIKTIIVQKYS